jgi:hypothetical protein
MRDRNRQRRLVVFSNKLMSVTGAIVAVGAVVGAAALPAFAHHAASLMFSPDKEVVLTGLVKQFRYINPHATLEIQVQRGGQNVEWRIITESPNDLEKAGVDETSLRPGETVTVRARPSRTGGLSAWLLDVKKADGTVLSVDE